MSEEKLDQVHDIKEQVWAAVHDLVDELTEGLPTDVDELVRTQLTEQFRFWRR